MRHSFSRPRRGLTAACLATLLLCAAVLGGCGGGSSGDEPAPPVIVDGLSGMVLLPDFDLGRLNEQEPNDLSSQPYRLPPVWPGSVLEVAGTLESAGGWFGRVDPTDVLIFQCVESQAIALELTFEATDPTNTGVPNDFQAEVFRRATGVSVATTAAGGQPHTLVFDAAVGEEYEIVLNPAGTGTGWWVVRLTCSDLALSPKFDPAPVALQAAAAAHPVPTAAEGIGDEQRCAHDHVLVRMRAGCDADAVCERHGLRLGAQTGLGSHRVLFDTPSREDPESRVG
ncbi:MAG: hypothetical protein P1V36_18010 [Planctomycetota bacterium]|nr:hypothetical protein [Planctomycetota bacterium]